MAGWETDFGLADFNRDKYFLISVNKQPAAMVVLNEIRPGIIECHIVKCDIISPMALRENALNIIGMVKTDEPESTLICFIEQENHPAIRFVYDIGFNLSGRVANYSIFSRGL